MAITIISGAYSRSSEVWAELPATNAAVDGPMLDQWWAAIPEGGKGRLHAGEYQRTTEFALAGKHCSVEGMYAAENYAGRAGGFNLPATSPYVRGTVIRQMTPATHVLTLPTSGAQVNLKDLVLTFDPSFWFRNTADALYAVPSSLFAGLPDHGIFYSTHENIVVLGCGGNDVAFHYLNVVGLNMRNCRSYGGGGLLVETNSTAGNYGNSRFEGFYNDLFCAGPRHGIELRIVPGSGGILNLLAFHRPQSFGDSFPTSVFGALGVSSPAAPQLLFKADEGAGGLGINNYSIIQHDFESTLLGAGVNFGAGNKKFIDPAGKLPPAAAVPGLALMTGIGSGENNFLRSDLIVSRSVIQATRPTTVAVGAGAGYGASATIVQGDDYGCIVRVTMGNPLATPTGLTATDVVGGGNFAANTYYYKVVALNGTATTLGSADASVVVGANDQVNLAWTAVTGATSYKLYRSTTAGVATANTFVAQVTAPTVTYTDVGNATTSGNIPASNTTGPVAFGTLATVTWGLAYSGGSVAPIGAWAAKDAPAAACGVPYGNIGGTGAGLITPVAPAAGAVCTWTLIIRPGESV